eukprot:118178_1
MYLMLIGVILCKRIAVDRIEWIVHNLHAFEEDMDQLRELHHGTQASDEEFDGSIQNIRGLEIVQSATVVEHRRYNNVVIDNGHASDATDGDNDIDEEKGSEMINRRVVPYDPMDSDSRNHNVNNNAFAEMSESVPPTFQMDLDELIDDST